MEFKGIEHYDIFPDDVIVFWANISNPPQEIQDIAKEIDNRNFSADYFGLCVNYSFAEKEFYLVTDPGPSPNDRSNIFFIDQDGDKHWLRTDIPNEMLNQIFDECGKTVMAIEKSLETTGCDLELPLSSVEQAMPPLNGEKLEKRLEEYLNSEDFQRDIGALACDYQSQGLPLPPAEQLREEAAAEARKCLETIMVCEAKGHLWTEKADPENGTSELTCRRCGATENLQW